MSQPERTSRDVEYWRARALDLERTVDGMRRQRLALAQVLPPESAQLLALDPDEIAARLEAEADIDELVPEREAWQLEAAQVRPELLRLWASLERSRRPLVKAESIRSSRPGGSSALSSNGRTASTWSTAGSTASIAATTPHHAVARPSTRPVGILPRPVDVIVLCWNRWDLTERCLETLRTTVDRDRVRILVVDNGSTDETPDRVRELDFVEVITNPRNLGFVRGNNVGIAAAAPGHDVLLLNNDVELTQSDWLEQLAATAHSAADVGVVGCRLLLGDGRFLHAGTYILPDDLWGQQIGAGEVDVGQYALDREVQGIVFACAYLKREVVDAIGGLSEAFESYFEDTDYCLRARTAGFRTMLCGAATMVHHEHGSTESVAGMFDDVFARSRRVFTERWGRKLEESYEFAVSWQSILNFPTGYAMSCREILRGLDDLHVRVSYSYLYGKGSTFPRPEPENSGDHRLNLLARRGLDELPVRDLVRRPGGLTQLGARAVRPAARRRGRPELCVVYGQGDAFHRGRGRVRVGYTMLEVDGFPGEWVRQANEMDEVWVPSAFNRDAMLRCGVQRPVRVMPLGVDPTHFHPEIYTERNPSGDFVFLACFEWGERKAPDLLIETFSRTFRKTEPVVLVCKVINVDPSISVRSELGRLRLTPGGGRVAFLHNRELPYEQLGSLYRAADCFVSAGRGEGWDMPLMEAMACGLPTIATDWGAHREFVTSQNSYPLAVRAVVPAVAKCPYYRGFRWADPDVDHLSVLMRHVFDHQDEARERGRVAAREMMERWTWAHAAARIKQVLAGLAGGRSA